MTGKACTHLDEFLLVLIHVAGREEVDGIEIGGFILLYFIFWGKFDNQVTHFYFDMFTLWLSAELREAPSPVCQN